MGVSVKRAKVVCKIFLVLNPRGTVLLKKTGRIRDSGC